MTKRIFPLFLTLILCLELLPTAAMAADLSRYDWFAERDGWIMVGVDDESLPHFGDSAGRHEGDGLRYGFLDETGREIVAPQYRWIEPFTEGLARVWGNEGYGFLDRTGREVVPARYADAREFSQGLAAVREPEGAWGYVDREGTLVIPFRYDTADDFSEGLAAVGITDSEGNYLRGYIDREGNEVIPCQFDNVFGFQNGVAQVLDPGWLDNWQGFEPWRYIDRAGRDVTAYASTQTVLVNGEAVEFYTYALKDENGFDTNYVKLRDVAQVLRGTNAQFEVDWDGAIAITTGEAYTPNGSEMVQNFRGHQLYTVSTSPVKVNGAAADLEAITLTDAEGGGYTYFKLRDLGETLGFVVDWTAGKGIFLETGKAYTPNN